VLGVQDPAAYSGTSASQRQQSAYQQPATGKPPGASAIPCPEAVPSTTLPADCVPVHSTAMPPTQQNQTTVPTTSTRAVLSESNDPGSCSTDSPSEEPKNVGSSVYDTIFVFTREAEAALDASHLPAQDLADSDYDFTEGDLRRVMAGYASKRSQTTDQLMTRTLREARLLQQAQQYGAVPVRFELPDGVVVQASFPATTPLEDLIALIRNVLRPQFLTSVYLFTAPPKQELVDLKRSLYLAGLVPAARIFVGFKGEAQILSKQGCLKAEIMAKLGEPPSRRAAMATKARAEESDNPRSRNATAQQLPNAQQQLPPQDVGERQQRRATPNWLKLSR
jgi:hypothetical protein